MGYLSSEEVLDRAKEKIKLLSAAINEAIPVNTCKK
jgi:hypothetical protein